MVFKLRSYVRRKLSRRLANVVRALISYLSKWLHGRLHGPLRHHGLSPGASSCFTHCAHNVKILFALPFLSPACKLSNYLITYKQEIMHGTPSQRKTSTGRYTAINSHKKTKARGASIAYIKETSQRVTLAGENHSAVKSTGYWNAALALGTIRTMIAHCACVGALALTGRAIVVRHAAILHVVLLVVAGHVRARAVAQRRLHMVRVEAFRVRALACAVHVVVLLGMTLVARVDAMELLVAWAVDRLCGQGTSGAHWVRWRRWLILSRSKRRLQSAERCKRCLARRRKCAWQARRHGGHGTVWSRRETRVGTAARAPA